MLRFWIRCFFDPSIRIRGIFSGSPTRISTIFWVKWYLNSLSIGSNCFLYYLLKDKKNQQFCAIYAYKKGKTIFSIYSFLLLDPGSEIRDQKKIWIWLNIPDPQHCSQVQLTVIYDGQVPSGCLWGEFSRLHSWGGNSPRSNRGGQGEANYIRKDRH